MLQEDRLYRVVTEALVQDRLTLPTLPEVALRIGEACRDENVTAARIAAEISRDPAIAVRILRVANSGAIGRGRRIDHLQQAMARLGLGLVRSLVAALAMEQLFVSRRPALRERLRRIWSNTLEVAALSQVLADRCTILRPELAMLAGLVHDIGGLPVFRVAESLPEPPPDETQIDRAIRRLQPRVGSLILQAWDFPAELIEVPSRWMDFARAHEGPADYVDVVTVAALQSREGRSGRLAGIARERTPAFLRLDIDPDADIFSLDGVREAYRENLAALAS